MGKSVKRLYEQFQPENYRLDITIDKAGLKFSGTVIITGRKTGRPSNRLTFHQKDLDVSSATIKKLDKKSETLIKVSRLNKHKSYDELRLHTIETLYPGQYEITIDFAGPITKHMHGMYPCYFEHNGRKDWLIATQFESHHAREVFPSIDEPEAKATYDLVLTTNSEDIVLSNMPIKSEKKKDGASKKTIFQTTPVMSSYLLAWVIGDIHFKQAKASDGTEIRTWATAAQPKNFLKHANDEAVKVLEFFTEYFQTPFPLKKLDQIALPDFESGAMENWGLITYREIALLTDPVNRSLSSEQYISMVVAHEISHQWFGNLVTMKWWDDLWLNESFASLMEHIALDALHPDWFQWEQYTISDVLSCSNRDIYKDVQPVRVDVRHPDEIMTLFDPAIVYAKGGRLLKMLREYIGDDAFRKGLKTYFKKHAYRNTTREDLWSALSETAGKDISKFMDPWLEQSGMPEVSVEHTKEKIDLKQKRFVLDADDNKSMWPIPLLANNDLENIVLSKNNSEQVRTNNEISILNLNASGHMVVRYIDESSKQYLAESISAQKLLPEARINILNDMLLLSRKGPASITEALEIISKCSGEPRDAVWQQISRAVGMAVGLTEGDENIEATCRQLRRELATDQYKKLGWDDKANDDANTKGLRQTILGFMVAGEDKSAVTEAKKRYHDAKTVDDLPAEQRALIIGAVVRSGEDVADELIDQYKKTVNADIQLSIASGLTSTKNKRIGQKLIDEAIGVEGFVRPQDIARWYAYLMRNRYTRDTAWEWLTDSWPRLEKLFGDSKSFDHFIVYSASPLNTPDWQERFSKFFTSKMKIVALERNIKIALSEIDARVSFRQREEPKIKEFFSKSAR